MGRIADFCNVRAFSAADISDALAVWQAALPGEIMTFAVLAEKTVESPFFNPRLCLVALDDAGTLLGFISAFSYRHRSLRREGAINLICIRPDRQFEGIASKLLGIVEREMFIEENVERIHILGCPNYYKPGIDPTYIRATSFFEARGYSHTSTAQNLIVKYDEIKMDPQPEIVRLAQSGFQIARAKPSDSLVMDYAAREFPRFALEVRRALFRPWPTLFVAFHGEEIAAFFVADGNNQGFGGCGPGAVALPYRGRGLFDVLLKCCMRDTYERGHEYITLTWIIAGMARYYARQFDAQRKQVFWVYQKENDKGLCR